MKSHARVVVIGGGIIGCSVLYHLTRLGWQDVVLVERNELTSGASWHAAGQNSHYWDSSFLTRVAMQSLNLYRDLEAETGQACGVHLPGGVRLARSRDGIDEFKRWLGPANAMGIEADIIGPNRVRELWPLLESDNFLGALHTPGEGYVDAAMSTNALAKGARDAGAEIYRHTPVTGLAHLPSGEWQVRTATGEITAEFVVNAAGSWGGAISAMLGHQLPMLTMEHQYFVTEQTDILDGFSAELPVLRDTSVPFYCRQERDGLMVSAFEHEAALAWLEGAPADFAMELFPADLERSMPCIEQTLEMIPALKSLGIRTVVNGPIGATPDMQALLGPAHGLRNYFLCCGVHGGFVQGYLARYLAEWIVEGEPGIDLSSVDVRRFGDYADQNFTVSRVRAAHTIFSLPASYPEIEPDGGRPARKSGLYDTLAAKGAVFGVSNGWEVPNWFAPEGVERKDVWSFGRTNWFEHVGTECRAVRENAGVLDFASLAMFEVTGSASAAVLQRLSANTLPEAGHLSQCPVLSPSGGVDLLVDVHGIADDQFVVTAPAKAEQRLADWLRSCPSDEGVAITNVTNSQAALLLAGPKSVPILERALQQSLNATPTGAFATGKIDSKSVRLARRDDIDPNAWQIFCTSVSQPQVYDALMEAGAADGLVDFGQRAWNALRLERGVPHWGLDFSLELTPGAAGLGHLIATSKTGRQCQYRLVLLHIDDSRLETDPWGGEMLEKDGKTVGALTSGARGHTVGKSLAFAQLEPAFAAQGTNVEVLLLGERYSAVVIDPPL